MNIVVLMKQTIDTGEQIVLKNGRVSEEGVQFVINPYDEYAVEEAIRWKEELGGEVTVITIGKPRAEEALRTALAMGADKAVRIDPEDEEPDEYVTAKVLAAAVRSRPFDLILAGNMAVDTGAGQAAVRAAEELGIPHVAAITKLSLEGAKAVMERDSEGNTEIIEATLPLLATAQQGLNEPRYPSLPGIMKAKKKPLEVIRMRDLGLEEDHLTPRTAVLSQYYPPGKKQGRILTGELSEQVSELVQLLRQEAKVIG